MHFQWSNDFPNQSQFKVKRKEKDTDGEKPIRYPDLSLFLSMLHNSRIMDPEKVKRIYGKSVKPAYKASGQVDVSKGLLTI